MEEREIGTVKWFNESRGYGFIERPNGVGIFVHRSAIRGEGFKTLREGQQVEYEITQGPKGFNAVDVVVVGENSRAETREAPVENNRPGERETGIVKWFNEFKGYGFITRSQGGDAFFHLQDLRGEGFQVPLAGDRVEYKVVQGQKGLRAQDVVVVR